jgi:hypothetical protein
VDRTDEAALWHRKQSETFPMPAKKSRTEKQRNIAQKKKCATIIEEVENFEDLGRRMQELLLTSPEGTRIYLRVRDQRTVN